MWQTIAKYTFIAILVAFTLLVLYDYFTGASTSTAERYCGGFNNASTKTLWNRQDDYLGFANKGY
jgi:hypothetical protein